MDDLPTSCPVTGCDGQVRSGHLMCLRHWRVTPTRLQQAVGRTWRAFQRCELADTGATEQLIIAYRKARAVAVQWHDGGDGPYGYVRRQYGVCPIVGRRVRLENTERFGTIAPEGRTNHHHVKVRFDGEPHAVPCHPTSLEYLPVEQGAAGLASQVHA